MPRQVWGLALAEGGYSVDRCEGCLPHAGAYKQTNALRACDDKGRLEIQAACLPLQQQHPGLQNADAVAPQARAHVAA